MAYVRSLLRRCLPMVTPMTACYLYQTAAVTADDGGYGDLISSWQHWIYPLRPHGSEIKTFQRLLEMFPSHKTVCILGSTPELRDAAFVANEKVTCVDINQHTLQTLKSRMKYGNDAKEVLIQCDWMKMDEHSLLCQQQFDFIMSEEGINMLPCSLWDSLLDQIRLRLSDDGYVLFKVMCKPSKEYFKEVQSIEDIVTQWTQSNYAHDVGYLFVHLLAYLSSCKEDNQGIEWGEVIKCVKEKEREGKLVWSDWQRRIFFEKFGVLEDGDFTFYCKTDQEMREIFEKRRFHVEDIRYGKDEECKFMFTPIYVLSKQ